MTEDRPECRRLQFSLRRMLLWTALLALWLGTWRPLGFGQDFMWLTAWGLLVAIVSVVWSAKGAAFVSVGIAITLVAVDWTQHQGGFASTFDVATLFLPCGLFILVVVVGLFAIVD